MKASKYNRTAYVPETGKHLLFNGITTALISLDRESFKKAHEIMVAIDDDRQTPEDEQTGEIRKILMDGRFIIPRSVDELALLKVRYNVSRFNDPLSLTILPTLACNLACSYCYERQRREFMSQDTVNAICALVEDRARRERIREFHVSWYGGEPLLAAPTIWQLSRAFLDLSGQYDFRYTATMTTNGTLLTREVVADLLRYNVRGIQVTVDGPKEIHDARRPFKGGGRSSFDTIMNNLENVVGNIDIYIRMNTDKTNIGSALDLLDLFSNKGWLGEGGRLYAYMSQVSELTEACAHVATQSCPVDSFLEVSMEFLKACAAYGIPTKARALYHFPVSVKYNCGAIALNSMVINPSGAIHKCGLTVTDDNESLGNIREPLDLVNPTLLKWLNFDPFEIQECRECELFPVCLAACPKRVLDGESPTMTNSCKYLKRHIDEILVAHAT